MMHFFRTGWIGLMLLAVAACEQQSERQISAQEQPEETPAEAVLQEPAEYVGSTVCSECHEAVYALWLDSQHDLAMRVADEHTVLGRFETEFDHNSIVSRFFLKDGKPFVRTDGPDGTLNDYEIAYTFGVDPLQQYLIAFPNGAYQALGIAWDTRPADEGGQRWFHLYPDEQVTHQDPLHWTTRNQNWNFMCSDCHSTNVQKNFDIQDSSYATTWSEIDVACEACHGPGSAHVEWAREDAQDGTAKTKQYAVIGLNPRIAQIDTCAHCHARRAVIAEQYQPGALLLDHFIPALLDEGLYHVDGQILEEVYVYGSFLQSKMYRQGVRCTHCHDPHSAELKTPGNGTCTVCHQQNPPADFPTLTATNYDSEEHHFHPVDSDGSRCVACHMPAKLYMVIDERHDHSFRIPRPDLTMEHGVPNTCNACHEDQTAQWAAEQIAQWYGEQRSDQFASAFAGGRRGLLSAEPALSAVATNTDEAGIVRATALSLLQRYSKAMSADAIAAGLRDDDPLVRLGALRGAQRTPIDRRWRLAGPLLADPVHAIRIEAAKTLAPAVAALSATQRVKLVGVIEEYVASQQINAERPESHVNIGLIRMHTVDFQNAERSYRTALKLDPQWVPALVNLADLYRVSGRDGEGETLLQRALAAAPEAAEIHQVYGFWLARQQRLSEAVESLRRASELNPDSPVYAYTYGIALNSTGQSSKALEVLTKAHEQFPEDTNVLYSLVTIHRDRGERQPALEYAEKLVELWPYEPIYQQLIQELTGTGP